MMIQIGAAAMQATRAGQQRARTIARGAGLAQGRAANLARLAVPAARHERSDDVIADAQVRDAGPEFFHDAGAFMPEHHRQWPRPVAVDDRKIRMAKARGAHADQHLTRAGRIEVDIGHLERSGLRIGCGVPGADEDGGAGFHADILADPSAAFLRN
jgi:hypothetical protein